MSDLAKAKEQLRELLHGPVPNSARNGSFNAALDYKAWAARAATLLRQPRAKPEAVYLAIRDHRDLAARP